MRFLSFCSARRSRSLSAVVAQIAGIVTFVGLAAVALSSAAPATARNAPGPHDPAGSVTSVQSVSTGLHVSGWAYDPDAPNRGIRIVAVVDGAHVAASTATTLANATVTRKYHTNTMPGFAMTVPVTGRHTVCIIAKNTIHGLDSILHCAGTPLGHGLPGQHSPNGAVTHYWANPSSVHFVGWASDPDELVRQSVVVMYIDNQAVKTVATEGVPSPQPASAGPRSVFNIKVPTSVGSHVVCLWVVNAGPGSNHSLGCRVVDNRGKAGTDDLATPALNRKVIAEAKKHIGQPYVWGAIGPKKFDCSGLVMYSYQKNGFDTPRISQDQFFAARAIPASRVRPGDLVFYFDGTGDVYHVGIYLSPGKTVAAIDEQEGVDYQAIWPGSGFSYGSFTHD